MRLAQLFLALVVVLVNMACGGFGQTMSVVKTTTGECQYPGPRCRVLYCAVESTGTGGAWLTHSYTWEPTDEYAIAYEDVPAHDRPNHGERDTPISVPAGTIRVFAYEFGGMHPYKGATPEERGTFTCEISPMEDAHYQDLLIRGQPQRPPPDRMWIYGDDPSGWKRDCTPHVCLQEGEKVRENYASDDWTGHDINAW